MSGGTMRAFELTGPRQGEVLEVPTPDPAPGGVVVEVERVGVCGTDLEFFTGEMAYLHSGIASYPIRLGHEWCGQVSAVGDGVDPHWVGRRVMGDTMIGDGTCRRCRRGDHHVCANLTELGLRDGSPGALAERIAVAAASLHPLPDSVDPVLGALVEPGGNAVRVAWATGCGAGDRALVLGPGTIGLLTGMFLRAAGVEVHFLGVTEESLAFARGLGFDNVWTTRTLPALAFDAVADATSHAQSPARALELVEPSGRVVCIGLAGAPSTIDTRTLTLKDVTAVGILGASQGLDTAITAYADGSVDPRALVAATVGLDRVGAVLAGTRPDGAGPGPKIHIDPRQR